MQDYFNRILEKGLEKLKDYNISQEDIQSVTIKTDGNFEISGLKDKIFHFKLEKKYFKNRTCEWKFNCLDNLECLNCKSKDRQVIKNSSNSECFIIRCERCYEMWHPDTGETFRDGNPHGNKKYLKIYKKCPKCDYNELDIDEETKVGTCKLCSYKWDIISWEELSKGIYIRSIPKNKYGEKIYNCPYCKYPNIYYSETSFTSCGDDWASQEIIGCCRNCGYSWLANSMVLHRAGDKSKLNWDKDVQQT